MEDRNTNPIQSADRIFTILETLAEHGSMRIIDLSDMLGLHKSTVHRLLASLISMGYVTHNEASGAYSLTFKLVEISGKILKNTDILTLVHPYMLELSEKCEETVHFVQRSGNTVIYLDKTEAPSVKARSFRLSSQVGLTRPMYCSGVGKAILAQLPTEEVADIWNSCTIEKRTEHTITSLEALNRELETVRETGYALDNEENELGIRCIAVPVSDYRGRPIYAISISSLSSRMPDERMPELAALLAETASKLSFLV